ncbi:hypothetical protein KFK09_001637 [Dendrobium nobile]|uniref:Uncharacterized protein n=1 Tax=Dendrobium nobile TaxID=94219 RepID=A0A8T3CAV8_DENNO|nr:hypothetical protein KFK09_001637 [Dendrobium nobile]
MKDHALIDNNHMSLLDELNKQNDLLKSSYIELEKEFKFFKNESENMEHYLKYDINVLEDINIFLNLKVQALKKNRKPPKLEYFTYLILKLEILKPRKKQTYFWRLKNPFLGVKCFTYGMIGHILHTYTLYRKTHLVWRPKCIK